MLKKERRVVVDESGGGERKGFLGELSVNGWEKKKLAKVELKTEREKRHERGGKRQHVRGKLVIKMGIYINVGISGRREDEEDAVAGAMTTERKKAQEINQRGRAFRRM